jgi:hypothetical protein
MESGLTDLEFKRTICSSFDYIKSRSVIAKYLANKPDLLEKYHDSRIIRMSIKNDEGKVGKVELYDLSGTLIILKAIKTIKRVMICNVLVIKMVLI